MKEGWRVKKLGELFDITSSKRVLKKDWKDTGVPFYRAREIVKLAQYGFVKNQLFIDDGMYNLYKEKYGIPQEGDIMITGVGTLGTCYVVKSDDKFYFKDGNIIWLKKVEKVNSRYIEYAFKSDHIIKQVNSSVGATVGTYTIIRAKNTTIPIPPLAEQKKIVAILDEAFAAIDKAKANAVKNLNNAKELFESYLQAIFTNNGTDWEEKTVKQLISESIIEKPQDGNHGEIHPLKTDYVEAGVPFIMSRDMKNGGVDQVNCKFITEKQAKSLRIGFAKDGDVLLSHKGTIGSVSVLNTINDFVILTPQITYYRIVNKAKLYNRFLYYYFLTSSLQRTINEIAGLGSTRAYIGITKQQSLSVSYPKSIKEQQTIVSKLDALSAECKKLEAVYLQKIDNLEELKKSLLQKAFNGELTYTPEPATI